MPPAIPRLHRAAAHGDEEKLKQYLKARDKVNARDAEGRTALSWAVSSDQTNCARILLAAGAGPSPCDKEKFFPLYVSAANGNLAITEALIKANANVDAIIDSPEGGTALNVAAYKGDTAIVKTLLDAGCDTSKRGAGGHYPLTTASLHGHAIVVKMLLDAGADVSAMGSDNLTALTAGVHNKSRDVVERLLEGGADVNQPNPDGRTALFMAAIKGSDEMINVLVAAGAILDKTADIRRTPLHAAAHSGHPNCVWALLRAGANVSARDCQGSCPLHLAAEKGFTDIIEILLAGGGQADVNLEDHLTRTPLKLAAKFADAKAVNLLLAGCWS